MTADVYGNIIYGNNAKGNNRDTLFHLGLMSFCFLHVLLHLLFCVCKHFSKVFTLSTQVPKFKSAKQLYRVNNSVVRPLQGLASTKG